MSPRTWQKRVADILAAISEIGDFTRGMGFDDFASDLKTQKAVVLNFVIIGEAARSVPDEVTSQATSIPWPVMRGMRNRLVHAYFAIDPQIVWETVQNDLPPLVDPLRALLAAHSAAASTPPDTAP